jgi:3-hydroxyisobutyrate dehydrogenase-like beta-hydroxyacid dehydrogenase
MGQAMAARLQGGGHELVVYNRTREKCAEVEKQGAKVASSMAEACKGREAVISMVTDDKALAEVVKEGVVPGLPKGAIHVAMGTHSVAALREIQAAHDKGGLVLVAAPVLGRPDLAASGQLGIVVAGPEDAVARCNELLKQMGRRIFAAGVKPESATAIKLANNAVLGCAMVAMAEGFALVRKYDVAPQVFQDVMVEGLFGATAYKVYGQKMVDQSFDQVGSPITVGLKDANLIAAAANLARVPMPSHNVYVDRLLGCVAHGDADRDQAVLAREQARASGLE